MEMVFLAEFEVVVNHDLRIPFQVNLLEQLLAFFWCRIGFAQMEQVDSCFKKLVDVLCFMRNKGWCCDYNPFHFFLLLYVFLVSCFSSEAVSYEC